MMENKPKDLSEALEFIKHPITASNMYVFWCLILIVADVCLRIEKLEKRQ